jgi:hypothetical protein
MSTATLIEQITADVGYLKLVRSAEGFEGLADEASD